MNAQHTRLVKKLRRLKRTVDACLSLVERFEVIEDADYDRFLPPEHRGKNAIQLGDFVIYERLNVRR